MPGGLLGSIGSDNTHPPIYAIAAVYGGMILLTRVWIGLLRQLSAHRGVPVRRVVIVVVIWALPLLVAPPLFSRDVYSYAGQGEMVSHHIDPYVYGTGVLGSTPFSTMPDSVWTNTPSPYGPDFPVDRRASRQGLRSRDPSRRRAAAPARSWPAWRSSWRRRPRWPAGWAGIPPAPSSSAPGVPWSWPRSSGGRTTRHSCSGSSWRVSRWPSDGARFPASCSVRPRPG